MGQVANIGDARGRGRPRGDGWDLSDSGYDLNRFYTATRVGEAEAEKIQIKIPGTVWARICAMASDPQFPSYRTPHDVFRDAVTHRLHYLASNDFVLDADLLDWVQMQVRQGEVERIQAMMRAARDVVIKFGEALGDAEREKDWELARVLLEQGAEAAGELRHPYAGDLSRLIEEFERRIPTKTGNVVRGKGLRG